MYYEISIEPVFFVICRVGTYYSQVTRYELLRVIPGELKDLGAVHDKYVQPSIHDNIRMLIFARHEGEDAFLARRVGTLYYSPEEQERDLPPMPGPTAQEDAFLL
jgi:hypothetical protein